MDQYEGRHVRLSQRSIVYATLFIILLFALYYLRELVYVFLTSIVIASFVESAVRRFKRHGVGRTIAVIIVYFCVLAIFGFLLYLFVPIFLEELGQFSGFLTQYLPNSAILGTASNLDFPSLIGNFQGAASSVSGGALESAIIIFGGLFNFVILIVLSFYLSMNEKGIETFLRIVSPSKEADYIVNLWDRTERKIGLWFQGQLLLALLVGILIYLGLLIFNIKYALLLSLLAAVMELIPFGIILAAIPAIAAGYTAHAGTGAFEVAGLFLIVHEFEINLISPLIVQKVVGISPLLVILSLLVCLKIAGFWGIILAIPAAVLLMEFLSDVKKKKGLLT